MSFLRLGGGVGRAGKFPGFKILGDVVLSRLSSGLLSRLYTTYEAVSQNHVDGFDLKITRRKLRIRTCTISRVYSVRKYSEVLCVPECVYSPAKCLATNDGSDIGQSLTPSRPLSDPLERDKGVKRCIEVRKVQHMVVLHFWANERH